MTQAQRTGIKANWHWKQYYSATTIRSGEPGGLDPWTPCAQFPSEVHVELLRAGRIPDPYIGFNEHDVQWVGERDWLYLTSFSAGGEASHYSLEFEGLDTFCDIHLNGSLIASTDNGLRPHNIELNNYQFGEINTLYLHFKSAKQRAKDLEAQHGRVRAGSTNLGDPSRVYVRKAQYDWRWDWGPELMTVGPYRPIWLHSYTTRLSEVDARAVVTASLERSLGISARVHGQKDNISHLRVSLQSTEDGHVVLEETIKVSTVSNDGTLQLSTTTFALDNEKVSLWYPRGSGPQPLYELVVTLYSTTNDSVLDEFRTRLGFRRVELVQESLQDADQYGKGTSFYFRVNNMPVFCGGSNWIPADNFLTTVSPERYHKWLELAAAGGQNMVRIWGGGVYEHEAFYEKADELGLMVWQDFMFACGVYPAHDGFVENVRGEAVEAVKRLRHHASIVVWCGNNEDYQMVHQWPDVPTLPARVLYEDVLPSIVEQLSPDTPYVRGSPYGGQGTDTSDPTVGDVHQWDIWGGKGMAWQEYDRMGGRFVSEFGIPSMPSVKTVDHWMGEEKDDPKHRHPQSAVNAQHCRAGLFARRFAVLMNENLRLTDDLETYVWNTQLLQSEAMSWAYQSWRRAWKGDGHRFTGGALVWQLNDCWPVTSWAIVDYFMRPKPAYYAIKRALAPISFGMAREVQQNRANDRPRQFYEFGAYQSVSATLSIWAANSTMESRHVTLEVEFIDLGEGGWTHKFAPTKHVLGPNGSTELLEFKVPAPEHTKGPHAAGASVVIGGVLKDAGSGEVIARAVDWPQPWVSLQPPDPKVDVQVREDHVVITVGQPVKGLWLDTVGSEGDELEEVQWSDNGLDLLPGERRVIRAGNLGGRTVTVAYLGYERATAV